LPAVIWAGFTTPARRMYSVSLLMATCFSPATTRWPLASTSTTVTVMEPLISLELVSLSLNSCLLLAEGSQVVPTVAPPLTQHHWRGNIEGGIRLAFVGGFRFALGLGLFHQVDHGQGIAHIARLAILEQGHARPGLAVAGLEDGAVGEPTGTASGRTLRGCLMAVAGGGVAQPASNARPKRR
jgi:hypothetical protein